MKNTASDHANNLTTNFLERKKAEYSQRIPNETQKKPNISFMDFILEQFTPEKNDIQEMKNLLNASMCLLKNKNEKYAKKNTKAVQEIRELARIIYKKKDLLQAKKMTDEEVTKLYQYLCSCVHHPKVKQENRTIKSILEFSDPGKNKEKKSWFFAWFGKKTPPQGTATPLETQQTAAAGLVEKTAESEQPETTKPHSSTPHPVQQQTEQQEPPVSTMPKTSQKTPIPLRTDSAPADQKNLKTQTVNQTGSNPSPAGYLPSISPATTQTQPAVPAANIRDDEKHAEPVTDTRLRMTPCPQRFMAQAARITTIALLITAAALSAHLILLLHPIWFTIWQSNAWVAAWTHGYAAIHPGWMVAACGCMAIVGYALNAQFQAHQPMQKPADLQPSSPPSPSTQPVFKHFGEPRRKATGAVSYDR